MNAQITKGTAVITGASSGIGAVYADRFAKQGYDLILVARNRERLESVASRLKAGTGRSIEVVVADFNNRKDVSRVEDLLRSNAGITTLVNNAGVGAAAPLLQSDIGKMEDMITLNVTALTRLTYAVVPGFVARGAGTIINIASIVGVAPEFLNGVYGGTKAFVVAFSQSLRHELAEKGVRVQTVLPGATATEFWNIAGLSVENLPEHIEVAGTGVPIQVMSAEDMVDASLAGLDQGEFVTIPALPNNADWEAFEAARQALFPNLSRDKAADRYRIPQRNAA